LIGVVFLLIGSCNGFQVVFDKNLNRAVGGGVIALVFHLAGVALAVMGIKSYMAKGKPKEKEGELKKCPSCAEDIKKEAVK
jgi:hypothetical protein